MEGFAKARNNDGARSMTRVFPRTRLGLSCTLLAILFAAVCAYYAHQDALHHRTVHDAARFMELSVNLQRIALAVNAYEKDTGGALDSSPRTGGPHTPWRTRILPYAYPHGRYGSVTDGPTDTINPDLDAAYRELFTLGLGPRNHRNGYTSIFLVEHVVGDSEAVCVVALRNREEFWLTPSDAIPLSEVTRLVPRLTATGTGKVSYIENGEK